jgi:hypothetical protein
MTCRCASGSRSTGSRKVISKPNKYEKVHHLPHYHWVLSKMVTDDSQITEGLRTKGMNK